MIGLTEDTAISKVADDLFGRQSLVEMITQAIIQKSKTEHRCYTIGIYGKWGEGKTSVLNMVEAKLLDNQHDDIIISKFNPWLFNDHESLLMAFFSTIAKEPVSRAWTKKVKEYAPMVALGVKGLSKWADFALMIGGMPPVAGVVGQGTANAITQAGAAMPDLTVDTAKRKKEVADTLKRSKKHLVIFIDDIDRLDKNETHTLFKLIKQNADFDNVTYLLAMDVEMVAKSIGERYGAGGISDGYNFIDKIVQVPVMLPKIQPSHLKQVLDKQLKEVFDRLPGVNDTITAHLAGAHSNTVDIIAPLFTTGRDVIRYINQLQFVLPVLYAEVNVFDLCLLEALKLFNINGYMAILHHKDLILGAEYDIGKALQKDYTEIEEMRKEQLVSDVLADIPTRIMQPMRSVIRKNLLSPFLSSPSDNSGEDEKRLCSRAYFDKYFMGCSPNNVVSDVELYKIYDTADVVSEEILSDFFDSVYSRYGIEEVGRTSVFLILQREELPKRSTWAKKISIALSLMKANDRIYYNPQRGFGVDSIICDRVMSEYMRLAAFSKDIRDDYDLDALRETVDAIVSRANLYFAIHFIWQLLGNFVLPIDKEYKAVATDKLRSRLFKEKGEDEIFKFDKSFRSLLFKAWKAVNTSEFNEFFKRKLNEPTFDIINFIQKSIEETTNGSDYLEFVRLFDAHKEGIYKAAKSRVSKEVQQSNPAIRLFMSNCTEFKKAPKAKV